MRREREREVRGERNGRQETANNAEREQESERDGERDVGRERCGQERQTWAEGERDCVHVCACVHMLNFMGACNVSKPSGRCAGGFARGPKWNWIPIFYLGQNLVHHFVKGSRSSLLSNGVMEFSLWVPNNGSLLLLFSSKWSAGLWSSACGFLIVGACFCSSLPRGLWGRPCRRTRLQQPCYIEARGR